MKITYLAYQPQKDGTKALTAISEAEWRRITEENKTASKEQYRYFESDVIVEGNEIDMLVIEVPFEEHQRINAEKKSSARQRELEKGFQFLSLDAPADEDTKLPGLSNLLHPDRFEDEVTSAMDLEILRKALAAWKPWANDFLDFYISGDSWHAATKLARKYGMSSAQFRRYRAQFEEFLKKFYFG